MNQCRPSSGFTLLELLAAAAITVLLAGLVLAVTTGALDLWRKAQGDFSVVAEAGMAFDLLERDLQAAGAPAGQGGWLAVSVARSESELRHRGWTLDGARRKPGGPTSFRPLPGATSQDGLLMADARFGLSGAWLKMLTVTAESGTERAWPRAVAWQIARRPLTGTPGSGNPAGRRYILFRSAMTGEETFALGGNLAAEATVSISDSPAGTRAPSTLSNPAVADAVIANVVDFGIWLYGRNPAGALVRIFPEHGQDTDFRADETTVFMPVAADVMVRVLNEEGARQIELIENGVLSRPAEHASDGAWWWSVAEANSRVLVRRVALQGGRP